MKDWILICHGDNEINRPQFYSTKDEAVKAMCVEVADILGMTTEEVMETRLKGVSIDDYALVGDDYAFIDRHEQYDWRIFDISWENSDPINLAVETRDIIDEKSNSYF